jgi:transcriptional regulator with XRE-family HTH domain
MVTPQAFGEYLRRRREKRKITLEAVARATNVRAGLFAALERGDCSRWPGGIYNRGYVRGYAIAIGLDPEETVQSFCRCFPDPLGPVVRADAPAPASIERISLFTKWRLALVASWRGVSTVRR